MTPAWIVSLVTLLLFTGFVGYRYGTDSAQITCDAKQSVEQQAAISAENSARNKERDDNKETNEVSHDYQTHISAIDDLYAHALTGLQSTPDSRTGAMPAIPVGVAGHNATACTTGLPRRTQENLIQLMKQADLQAAQLVACQAWITVHEPKN